MKKIRLFLAAIILTVSLSGCQFFLGMAGGAIYMADNWAIPRHSYAADFDVVENLSYINLIDHDLGELSSLRLVPFFDSHANVTVIADGTFDVKGGTIINDAWAIEIYYFTRSGETALESVAWSASFDKEHYFSPHSNLEIGQIHTSPDHQTAFLAIVDESDDWPQVCIYIAQNIDGTDLVVVMDIVLLPLLWESQDDIVLAELSWHIGVDLSDYTRSFGGQFV